MTILSREMQEFPLLGYDHAALAALAPRMDEYFGCWCVEPTRFEALLRAVQSEHLFQHVTHALRQSSEVRAAGPKKIQADGRNEKSIAVVSLSGLLMKQVGSLSDGTSTVLARKAIREAANDPEIGAVLLAIDSPGGTFSGTQELVDEIRATAASRKPVWAQITDLGASAAYWAASAADKVFLNRTGHAGSIGTYLVLRDSSGEAAAKGVKVHVISTGGVKGSGVPGAPLTPEALAEADKLVQEVNDFFVRGVAAHRNLPLARARELADGRIHLGEAAVALGLVDGAQAIETTIEQLRATLRGAPTKPRSQNMSIQESTDAKNLEAVSLTTQATLSQLKAACPSASAEFLLAQLDAGADVASAQQAMLIATSQEKERLQAELALLRQTQKGAPPIGAISGKVLRQESLSEFDGDPVAEFDHQVRQLMTARNLDRSHAVASVIQRQPMLHKAYLLATNSPRVAGRIMEKFDN